MRHFQSLTAANQENSPGDLLGNLMLWCDRANLDSGAVLLRAPEHYQAETTAY